jgi:hypothetical protein
VEDAAAGSAAARLPSSSHQRLDIDGHRESVSTLSPSVGGARTPDTPLLKPEHRFVQQTAPFLASRVMIPRKVRSVVAADEQHGELIVTTRPRTRNVVHKCWSSRIRTTAPPPATSAAPSSRHEQPAASCRRKASLEDGACRPRRRRARSDEGHARAHSRAAKRYLRPRTRSRSRAGKSTSGGSG